METTQTESKTIKTVKVSLNGPDAIRLLQELGDGQWAVQLVISGMVSTNAHMALSIWTDGNETPHELTIKSDGTWAMTTHIEV